LVRMALSPPANLSPARHFSNACPGNCPRGGARGTSKPSWPLRLSIVHPARRESWHTTFGSGGFRRRSSRPRHRSCRSAANPVRCGSRGSASSRQRADGPSFRSPWTDESVCPTTGKFGMGQKEAARALPQCVKAKSFNPISSLPGILNPNFPCTDPSGKSHLSIATH
jgi:hypothetical protein